MTQLYDMHYTHHSRGQEDYGFRDQKGRAVGYAWSISYVNMVPKPDDARSGYAPRAHGRESFIQVWGSPTRDGKTYGPSFNVTDCHNTVEATVIVAKRIAQARKRDTKKFVK